MFISPMSKHRELLAYGLRLFSYLPWASPESGAGIKNKRRIEKAATSLKRTRILDKNSDTFMMLRSLPIFKNTKFLNYYLQQQHNSQFPRFSLNCLCVRVSYIVLDRYLYAFPRARIPARQTRAGKIHPAYRRSSEHIKEGWRAKGCGSFFFFFRYIYTIFFYSFLHKTFRTRSLLLLLYSPAGLIIKTKCGCAARMLFLISPSSQIYKQTHRERGI